MTQRLSGRDAAVRDHDLRILAGCRRDVRPQLVRLRADGLFIGLHELIQAGVLRLELHGFLRLGVLLRKLPHTGEELRPLVPEVVPLAGVVLHVEHQLTVRIVGKGHIFIVALAHHEAIAVGGLRHVGPLHELAVDRVRRNLAAPERPGQAHAVDAVHGRRAGTVQQRRADIHDADGRIADRVFGYPVARQDQGDLGGFFIKGGLGEHAAVADLIYRKVAEHVQSVTGVTTLVQNITGASGFVMATDLMSYDPDICELMLGTEALFAIAPLFNKDINISLDDYVPLFGTDGTTFTDWDLDPVPSVADIGYPEIVMEAGQMLMCRKGVDQADVDALGQIILDYFASDKGKADMAEINSNVRTMSAEDAFNRMKHEVETTTMIYEKYYNK